MSRWTETFKSHPFQANWKSILELISSLKPQDLTAEGAMEWARLNKVIRYVDEQIKSIDPELAPATLAEPLNSYLQNILNELRAYEQNRNWGHIQNANNYFDSVLAYLRPYALPGRAGQASSKAFKAYSESIQASLNEFQSLARITLAAINDTKIEAQEHLGKIASIVNCI